MSIATMATFADKVRELRDGRGWSQSQLAARAGIPVTTLQGLEQGRRLPSWPVIVALARAFDANSAIFDQCDEVAGPPPRRRKK